MTEPQMKLTHPHLIEQGQTIHQFHGFKGAYIPTTRLSIHNKTLTLFAEGWHLFGQYSPSLEAEIREWCRDNLRGWHAAGSTFIVIENGVVAIMDEYEAMYFKLRWVG